MQFGKKFDRDAASGNGNEGDYIRGFKPGETTVRFLEEIENWTEYWECYHEEKKRFFPSPGRGTPEQGDRKASRRYLVNCLIEGKVGLYKIPASLIERLIRRSDKNSTITDRDYIIIKTGKALNTEYDVESGDRAQIDLIAYRDQFTSHEKALGDAFVEVWGKLPSDPDDNQDAKSDGPPWEEDAKSSVGSQDGPPPSEPQRGKDAPVEDEVLGEDEIRDMSKRQLMALSERAGLMVDDPDISQEDLAEFILTALSE